MRNKTAILAAVSVPLILSAAGVFGGEPLFHTPSTNRAQQMQPLLSRAAFAVNTAATRTGKEYVSNLWLYPTADKDTIFAQYTVTPNQLSPKAGVSEEHFELLRIKGKQVVKLRDLTHAGFATTPAADSGTSVKNGRSSS